MVVSTSYGNEYAEGYNAGLLNNKYGDENKPIVSPYEHVEPDSTNYGALKEHRGFDYVLGIVNNENASEIELKLARAKLGFIKRAVDESYYHRIRATKDDYLSTQRKSDSVESAIDERRAVICAVEDYYGIGPIRSNPIDRNYERPAYRHYFNNLRIARKGRDQLIKMGSGLCGRLKDFDSYDDDYSKDKEILGNFEKRLEYRLEYRKIEITIEIKNVGFVSGGNGVYSNSDASGFNAGSVNKEKTNGHGVYAGLKRMVSSSIKYASRFWK